jgi:WhiB family redox-sensing transcriptional regulator
MTAANQLNSWCELALCRETDPEIFFPEKGGTGCRAAKRVCAACPVREQCLIDALARHDIEFGVLGGLAPRERRHLLHTLGTVERQRAA